MDNKELTIDDSHLLGDLFADVTPNVLPDKSQIPSKNQVRQKSKMQTPKPSVRRRLHIEE